MRKLVTSVTALWCLLVSSLAVAAADDFVKLGLDSYFPNADALTYSMVVRGEGAAKHIRVVGWSTAEIHEENTFFWWQDFKINNGELEPISDSVNEVEVYLSKIAGFENIMQILPRRNEDGFIVSVRSNTVLGGGVAAHFLRIDRLDQGYGIDKSFGVFKYKEAGPLVDTRDLLERADGSVIAVNKGWEEFGLESDPTIVVRQNYFNVIHLSTDGKLKDEIDWVWKPRNQRSSSYGLAVAEQSVAGLVVLAADAPKQDPELSSNGFLSRWLQGSDGFERDTSFGPEDNEGIVDTEFSDARNAAMTLKGDSILVAGPVEVEGEQCLQLRQYDRDGKSYKRWDKPTKEIATHSRIAQVFSIASLSSEGEGPDDLLVLTRIGEGAPYLLYFPAK